jgi:hypothetical protein
MHRKGTGQHLQLLHVETVGAVLISLNLLVGYVYQAGQRLLGQPQLIPAAPHGCPDLVITDNHGRTNLLISI